MQEQERRAYLQAMGISVWIPRYELPFAAPSVLLKAETEAHEQRAAADEFSIQSRLQGHAQVAAALAGMGNALAVTSERALPASPQAPAQKPPHITSQRVTSDARQGVSSAEGTLVETSPAGAIPVEAVSAETTPTETMPVVDMTPPRFELHFVLTGHVVWVCDQAADAARLAFFTARVATAMKYPQATLRPVCFRWPFIENPREDQSVAVARQALSAQWAFFEHHGGQALVAFGPHAEQWGRSLTARHRLFGQGLDAVLNSADLKRDLWVQLQDWHPTVSGE